MSSKKNKKNEKKFLTSPLIYAIIAITDGNNATVTKEKKMDKITVAELKAKLKRAIEDLDEMEDNAKIATQCNNYGMYGYILEVPTVGFVNILNIETEEDEED